MRTFSQNPRIGKVLKIRGGMTTGDNDQFLRLWYEVSNSKIGYGCEDKIASIESNRKWFPYQKGGAYRKWYGNRDFVVDWEHDGRSIIENGRGTTRSREFYFREALTYTATSSSYFGIRYTEAGFLFDAKGSFCVTEEDNLKELLGFLASNLSSYLLQALNPSIEFQAGDISRLPYRMPANLPLLRDSVDKKINIARTDWDNFETSWDFQDLPLLRSGQGLGARG